MHFWLYRKFIFQKKVFLQPATMFSIMGITFGVAFLVVAMAGFSGFTESLKASLIDVTGDVSVFKRGSRIDNPTEVKAIINESTDQVVSMMGFVRKEALVAANGKLSGAIMQGLDWEEASILKSLNERKIDAVKEGEEGLGQPAYLGKVMAAKHNLKVGDSFKLILPRVSQSSASRISPKTETFYVSAILDLGKYEFNERTMITSMDRVQKMAGMGDKINGFILRIKDSDQARQVAEKIQDGLGYGYSVRDWMALHRSLFKAIRYEKMVLFGVMLIMVVAAFFNVATTLFLGVMRRYSQISVMRALGLRRRDVIVLFCFHGLTLGVVGLILGLCLGLFFCWGFEALQKVFPIMPEEVYKMSNFQTHLEMQDVYWVILATIVICFLSTIAPALRGSRLSPVEGLKYE